MPVCPRCASNTRTFKVSQVYIAGITSAENRSEADRGLLEVVFGKADESGGWNDRLTAFAPPVVKPTTAPSIHPDFAVFLAAMCGLAFISLRFLDDTRLALYGYILLGIAILAYILGRRKILERFRVPTREAKEEARRVAGHVLRWSRLFYCDRDGCVFDPARGDWSTLEDLPTYLSAG